MLSKNLQINPEDIVYKFCLYAFVAYLICLLSFGRAFAIFYIDFFSFPLYVTELALLLSLPITVKYVREIYGIPRQARAIIGAYFALSLVHMAIAVAHHNTIALRDIVISGYVMFSAAGFTIIRRATLKAAIAVVVISNALGLIFGRLFLIGATALPGLIFYEFTMQSKAIHFGLYYGLATSFLIPLYLTSIRRMYRIGFLVLMTLDLYMIFVLSQRTTWLAVTGLFLFFFCIFRGKLFAVIPRLAIMLMCLGSTLYYFDYLNTVTRMDTVDGYIAIAGEDNMKANIHVAKVLGSFEALQGIALWSADQAAAGDGKKSEARKLNPIRPRRHVKDKDASVFTKFSNDIWNARDYAEGNAPTIIAADSVFWRLDLWNDYLEFACSNNPWLGVGFGKYPVEASRKLTRRDTPSGMEALKTKLAIGPPHNHLLTIFYKMGALGLLCFLLINLVTIKSGYTAIRKPINGEMHALLVGAVGAFIFWNIGAFFFDFIDSPPTSAPFWLLLGMIYGLIGNVESGYFRSNKPIGI